EIYRAELKMLGIHVLTTKEEEHADDDTMLGQMIRLWNGWKSEGERNDIIRRTQDGKRERVLKDHMLMGTHEPKFGWKYKDEKRGTYILNHDPLTINGTVLRDEHNEAWTEARIRRYIVDLVDKGESIRSVAKILTDMHIPTRRGGIWNATRVEEYLNDSDRRLNIDTPVLAYGFITVYDEQNTPYTQASITRLICVMHDKEGIETKKIANQLTEKRVPTGNESEWHPATVSDMIDDEFLIGKAAVYRYHKVKELGKKARSIPTPQSEWIYLPEGTVEPLLVTENGEPDIALYERVRERMQMNQKSSARNNKHAEHLLLHGGLARCGYCGGNMTSRQRTDKGGTNGYKGGQVYQYYQYRCQKMVKITKLQECASNAISQRQLDNAVWSKAVELIRDPSEIDMRVKKRKTEDPNANRRQIIKDELAKIQRTRATLTLRLEDPDLDDDSYADVKRRLKELKNDKDALEKEQSIQIDIHEEWKKSQQKLANFHKRCTEMRDKLDDPEFEPDFAFQREAVEFFGIRAEVWHKSHKPHFDITCNPLDIVSMTI
ncbi:MAG TPA: recombinase family protein, partial [Ktedonobacteraceae bacterium]